MFKLTKNFKYIEETLDKLNGYVKTWISIYQMPSLLDNDKYNIIKQLNILDKFTSCHKHNDESINIIEHLLNMIDLYQINYMNPFVIPASLSDHEARSTLSIIFSISNNLLTNILLDIEMYRENIGIKWKKGIINYNCDSRSFM